MGTANVLITLRALQKSANNSIKNFSCNYNDIENRKAVTECLQIMIQTASLKEIDFIGNGQTRSFKSEWFASFEKAGKNIRLFEEGEEDEDADEDQEQEDQDGGDFEDELEELTQKLEQLEI